MRTPLALLVGAIGFSAVVGLWLLDAVPGPGEVATALRDSGWIGALLYLGAFAGLQPWGLPGALFTIPAALVWPPALALGLSWLGANLAALIAFLFARWAGRDWARGRLGPRLSAYDRRLAERGLLTTIGIRLLFVCAPPASWLLGVSRVPLGTFLFGTAVGLLPGIALQTFVGNRGLAAIQEQSGVSLLLLAAAIAAIVLYQRRARRSTTASPIP